MALRLVYGSNYSASVVATVSRIRAGRVRGPHRGTDKRVFLTLISGFRLIPTKQKEGERGEDFRFLYSKSFEFLDVMPAHRGVL